MMTLASLFDGSGGFPLAASINGIEPIWASEIEPFPTAVTKKQFPNMIHFGNISEIHGDQVPPVDIITAGSPCQDLSVSGKRAGLEDGERSHLFYQAIRIVKEMRNDCKKPRWFVWENVPGAFSSNDGADFQSVLESVAQIKCPWVSIPKPKKWNKSGLIVGDGFSIGWRVLDAQYWGVPQRRERIFLVADFDGKCAGKVLFESEGLSGYFGTSFSQGENLANGVGASLEATDRTDVQIGIENYQRDSRYKLEWGGKSQTLRSNMGTSGNNEPMCMTFGLDRASFNQGGGSAIRFPSERGIESHNGSERPKCRGSLQARDYKGIGDQDVGSDKLIY